MKHHGLTEDGERIVLQRFHGGVGVESPRGGSPVHRFAFLDLESTGLQPGVDRVIEVALAEVDVEIDTGRIVGHHATTAWLEDPKIPIPPEITELTGLTDEDVRGKQIPDSDVQTRLSEAKVIVAHNASFDRAMAVRRFTWLKDPGMPSWACSYRQIDWKSHGHRHANLENLAMDHGFFYSGHRATIDVEVLVRLLAMKPEPDADPYLCDLVADIRRPHFIIAADATPFGAKDELRTRGYRWDPDRKHWHTSVSEETIDAETEWIHALAERHGRGRAIAARIPFPQRFADDYEPAWEER